MAAGARQRDVLGELLQLVTTSNCCFCEVSLVSEKVRNLFILFIPLSHTQDTGPNDGGSHAHPATAGYITFTQHKSI